MKVIKDCSTCELAYFEDCYYRVDGFNGCSNWDISLDYFIGLVDILPVDERNLFLNPNCNLSVDWLYCRVEELN